MYQIVNADVLEWAKSYEGPKFHALYCDPPYHLKSIVERFGGKDSKPAKEGEDGLFQRISRGFMGNTWDGGDIAFRPETWELFKELLLPGAFGMAFSSTRTFHRMAVAIEDAGFIIHPTIFLWINGQGMPKATRVKGQEVFEGHRYGGQALKPAVEPIVCFQKPYEGRPVDNIIATGAGVLNIDGSRLALEPDDEIRPLSARESNRFFSGITRKEGTPTLDEKGRWPSNLILDEETSKLVDEQYGTEVSKYFYSVQQQLDEAEAGFYAPKASPKERDAGLDTFELKVAGGMEARRDGSLDGHITMRKNIHPTCKPIELNRYLSGLLLPPQEYSPRRLLVPFSGVASEMIGAKLAGWDEVVGVEMDTENGYIPIAEARLKHWVG